MKKLTRLLMLLCLLVVNIHVGHAAAENPEHFTAPEKQSATQLKRQVVMVAAEASEGQTISIPRDALTLRNNIPGVFVVENNEARFRMVRLGKVGKSRVDILSGLFGNETLVLGELDKVHDGSQIMVLATKTAVKK